MRIQGVAVGNMDARRAAQVVSERVTARLRRPVLARAGGRTFELTPQTARLRVDVRGAVRRAVAAGRDGPFPIRAWRRLTGRDIDTDVALRPTVSRRAVTGLVERMHAELDERPRDAAVTPRASGLVVRTERAGRRLQDAGLATRIVRALTDPARSRVVVARVERVAPRVTARALARLYPAYIVVDRRSFALRLYRNLEHVRTYRIAVGKLGAETPTGLYHVQSRQVNPTWYVPDSAWAGELAGQVIAPGPRNPLKARWIGFDGAAGIHGTDDLASLGTAASQGCIRMAIPDIEELYGRVPARAPIYIA